VERDNKLEISLLIMRLTFAAFIMVWAVDKLVAPEHAQKVFSHYYFTDLPFEPLTVIGIVQIIVILAFAAGFLRFWTYGAMLVMHAVSTLSTYDKLISPWEAGPRGLLFWAAVPTLGAIIALFVMRDRDNLLSVDAARLRKSG
jgi:putative oxidoreductase